MFFPPSKFFCNSLTSLFILLLQTKKTLPLLYKRPSGLTCRFKSAVHLYTIIPFLLSSKIYTLHSTRFCIFVPVYSILFFCSIYILYFVYCIVYNVLHWEHIAVYTLLFEVYKVNHILYTVFCQWLMCCWGFETRPGIRYYLKAIVV